MSVATVVIHNEVYCKIHCMADHIKQLVDKHARFAKGYRYDQRYKLGRWDGKIKFFHSSGKSYVYMLEDIVTDLANCGYEIKLVDHRSPIIPAPPKIDPNRWVEITTPLNLKNGPIILRDYQYESIDLLLQNANGIIEAATGAGKSIMIATLADAYGAFGLRTIVVVPSENLVQQTIEESFGLFGMDVGAYYGESKDLNHQYVIATWQALQHQPQIMQQFQVLVIDEAHGQKAKELTKLVCEYGQNAPYRFGFTGTMPPDEVDYLSVVVALGPVRYEIKAHELIERKILAKLDIQMVRLNENLEQEWVDFVRDNGIQISYKQFKKEYFPDYDSEKNYLQRKPERMQYIVKFIQDLTAQSGNTLVLVDRVAYADRIAAAIPGAYRVESSTKKKKKQEGKDTLKRFDTEDNITVVSTIKFLGTGINVKRIYNMVYVDMTKSFISIIQGIGRGLRVDVDKDSVNLVDIYSDLKYSKDHATERRAFYTKEQHPFTEYELDYTDDNHKREQPIDFT